MSMRLNEFTDASSYTLSADEMASIIKQVTRVWRGHGIEADAPMILQIIDEPEDKKGEVIDASAKLG
jgi:hypothetical protein